MKLIISLISIFISNILTFCFAVSSAEVIPDRFVQAQYIMGTIIRIEIYSESPEKARLALQSAFSEIRKYDQILSNYKPDSEIMKVMKTASDKYTKVSPELFEILKKSLYFSEITDGYFDITVGPLVKLWGFKNKNFRFPEKDQINQVLGITGYRNIFLNPYESSIYLDKKGMEIDFGAIGKGFAIDKAVEILKSLGIKSAVIDSVSNQYYLGSPPGKEYWHVGIKNPRDPEKVIKYLKLKNQAISSSGDYEQYFFYEGRRYSHIINPKTGYPISEIAIACTVISNNSADADALSTAVLLMPADIRRVQELFPETYFMKIVNKNGITGMELYPHPLVLDHIKF